MIKQMVTIKIVNVVSFFLGFSILLLFTVLLFLVAGLDPLTSIHLLFYYGFGSPNYLVEALLRSVPLLLISLGLMFTFIAGVWNIGAEGQFCIGAIVAASIALYTAWMPFPIPLILATIGGGLGGALYALVPAYLRAVRNINEVLTSLMLNYIAIYFVSYLILGPLRNPTTNFAETPPIPETAIAPRILSGYRLNYLSILAFTLIPITLIVLSKTGFGMSIRFMGQNPIAADFIAIDRKRLILRTMFISGFLAGLAAAHEVLGVVHAVRQGISSSYGYISIGIAYFGGLHPIGIFLVSLLAAGIINGTRLICFFLGIPIGLSDILFGALPIFVFISNRVVERLIVNRLIYGRGVQ
ncbi:MAG: ABC transporter permease [Ignisphaera sp.]